MADRTRRKGKNPTPNGEARTRSRYEKAEGAKLSVEHNFYAPEFTEKERADLELNSAKGSLDDEIALLKILIRRRLQAALKQATDKQTGSAQVALEPADGEAIRRYVDTLCRAIRIKSSLSGKGGSDLKEAGDAALAEVASELGIAL